ncbi:glycosyltransferase [Pseudarthrobacter sp. NPDC058196]|uniref:glycosyltransferase n=1 Tax=Pseudarthrobacter sp. NPDC058196 TaxID=3346376 RepID=UPI0036DD2CEC
MTKAKLRITILGINYAPEPTGNAPYTTSLAEGLSAAGHSVRVVTGYPHYPEWTIRQGYTGWSRHEVINGVPVERLRHHVPRTPTALSRMHMELSFGIRLLTANWHNPDVVLVVSPALLSSALAILRIRLRPNRPAVGIWIQDLYSRGVVETGTGGSRLARIASRLESKILRSADGVTAIHDRFKRHMVDALGVPAGQVEVIRNWTHLSVPPHTETKDVRARLGWTPGDVIVLHAGNMGKKQGLENVVEAARIAEERGSAVHFVLMGNGNQRHRLEELAKGLSSISFVDPLPGPEFQRALAAADILLVNELPGLKDMAVPSKLTSYFNSGTPVLAATDPGSVTAYEIAHSRGGLLVGPGDAVALVKAAETLAGDPAGGARLAANALHFRRETLSESLAVAHYDEFITRLASSRGR